MHRNLVQLSGDACREGYIGERGFESGSYQLNALPYADFFGYFLVQRQERNAPQGTVPPIAECVFVACGQSPKPYKY